MLVGLSAIVLCQVFFLRDGVRAGICAANTRRSMVGAVSFPSFQLLTAYVVKLIGSSVDTAGRAV